MGIYKKQTKSTPHSDDKNHMTTINSAQRIKIKIKIKIKIIKHPKQRTQKHVGDEREQELQEKGITTSALVRSAAAAPAAPRLGPCPPRPPVTIPSPPARSPALSQTRPRSLHPNRLIHHWRRRSSASDRPPRLGPGTRDTPQTTREASNGAEKVAARWEGCVWCRSGVARDCCTVVGVDGVRNWEQWLVAAANGVSVVLLSVRFGRTEGEGEKGRERERE